MRLMALQLWMTRNDCFLIVSYPAHAYAYAGCEGLILVQFIHTTHHTDTSHCIDSQWCVALTSFPALVVQ